MSIKNIREKKLLINLSKTFGQEIDPSIVEEVNNQKEFEQNLKNSIRQNWLKDLQEALQNVTGEVNQIKEQTEYPKPPSLDNLQEFLINDEKENILEAKTESLAERAAKSIKLNENSYSQPDPLLVPPDINSIQKKIKFLEQWLGKISANGPGGGAGNTITLDYPVKLITGNYTLTKKDYYVGVNANSSVTITLPSSIGFSGRKVIIKDESGHCSSNPITVLGNVDNDSGGFVLSINNGSIQMIYREGWRII